MTSDSDVTSPRLGGVDAKTISSVYCPNGSFVTGMTLRMVEWRVPFGQHYVDAIQFKCSDGSVVSTTGSPVTDANAPPSVVFLPVAQTTLDCPDGFNSILLRPQSLTNNFSSNTPGGLVLGGRIRCQQQTLDLGSPQAPVTSFDCGNDRVLVGATFTKSPAKVVIPSRDSAFKNPSGDIIASGYFVCSALSKCSQGKYVVQGNCEYFCSDPNFRATCIDAVKSYCRDDLTRPYCSQYLLAHQGGDYDDIVEAWCKKNEQNLANPLCSCYVPLGNTSGIPQWVVDTLEANPQCANATCNISGYKSRGIYNRPCPDLTIQNCIQMTTVNSQGQIAGDVSLSQASNCSQFHSSTPPPDFNTGTPTGPSETTPPTETPPSGSTGSSNLWWILLIVLGVVVLLGIFGFVIYGSSGTKTKGEKL